LKNHIKFLWALCCYLFELSLLPLP
jgi:hypothetical protein